MSAVLSPCGSYRYALWRPLQRQLVPLVDETGDTVLFVMLNPSTADSAEDDPTIRRCLGFARREGFARLAVGNLYALRSTDPAMLGAHPDPVGPENDLWLRDLAAHAELIVVAWGESGPIGQDLRATHVLHLLHRTGTEVRCLGHTRAGEPRHPLRLPAAQALQRFSGRAAA